MILLRQKLYTINDRKVFKEIHNATGGFRKLPKKVGGITTRDFFRMDKLSKDIYNGSKVDWEEFRTLAEHLGLPETAKHGRHAIEKFSNPELIKRYQSIRAHKLGVGKELEELRRLKKEHTALQESIRKAEESLKTATTRAEKGKYFEQKKSAEAALQNWWNNNNRQYHTLADTVRDKVGFKDFEGINRKIAERGAKGVQDTIQETRTALKEIPINNPLANKMMGDIRKSGINVEEVQQVPGNIAMYYPHANTIKVVKEKGQPAVLGHEWGHEKWYKRMRRLYGFEPGLTENPLYNIPNEGGASLEAYSDMLRRVKQGTATAKDLADTKRLLNSAGKQYYYGSVLDTATYIPSKLQSVPRDAII